MQDESQPEKRSPTGWQKYWEAEKSAAQKRLRKFRDRGNKVVDRYLDRRTGTERSEIASKLNLFHANVSTQQAMLYGQKPKIDVSREHSDPDDDVARVAANLYRRILEADCEKGPTALKAALLDRLLPGLGVCRVRYTFNEINGMVLDESAEVEYVHWQDFLWGWGRTWVEIPWIGFRSWLTKTEVKERFGEKIAKSIEYKNQLPSGEKDDEKDQQNNVQKAEIWEFWDKREKKVFWYACGADIILDSQDDPLNLQGFWPVPRPLTANLTTTIFEPTADFVLSQDLYNQIDILQTRITTITRAIKVVGVYDQSASDSVGRMLKEGMENELIPVENWAMFGEKGGLRGVIDWFPVEQVVNTLNTLRSVLGETMQMLYEVTGMSDLLRGGNTDQYAAASTSQLKAKFGSIRIQALQDEFARFASDLERLRAEIINKHFSAETIALKANARYLSPPDQALLAPALQLMQSPDARWRIDIRPESIAIVDHAQLKNERVEYLTALSTYIQSAQAMAKAVPDSMPVLLEFLKFGMAGFRGAQDMEGILDQAIEGLKNQQGQQDQGPSPEQMKLEAEKMKLQGQQMKGQMELQKIQAKAQADLQSIQAKLQGEIQKIQIDAQRDQALEDKQSQYALLEIARELEAKMAEIEAQTRSAIAIERTQAQTDMTVDSHQHRLKLAEINASGKVSTGME